MEIRLVTLDDASKLSNYYLNNATHFQPWSPLRETEYNTVDEWQSRLVNYVLEQEDEHAAYFVALSQDRTEIVGHCSLTNIIHGVFQACYMGYGVAEDYQSMGVATRLCERVIRHAFNTLGLHRIMANYMPRNSRSAALLRKLGFAEEGLAKKYLKINGRWEDHILTSLINPEE